MKRTKEQQILMQTNYVKNLLEMHAKVVRVCGVNSKQEIAMYNILRREEYKLEDLVNPKRVGVIGKLRNIIFGRRSYD
ncbi:MAG: hypothetical protein CMI26_08655 [Opitutae bacterium]|nr:hypothetical protein [Opitutae bacterium]